jgi:hypothetical protein
MEGITAVVSVEEAEGFKAEATAEIAREQTILAKVNAPRKGFTVGWILVLVILGISVIVLFLNSVGFLFWVLIAFILYGFNFIIWFIPTTRNKADEREKEKLKLSGKAVKGPIRYLLKKKKSLGVEIGFTMFLSGMVPLALSFFVLFGVGIILGLYFGFFRHLYDQSKVLAIFAQILVIMVFFAILVMLRPQERGFAQTARKFKGQYSSAKGRGRIAAVFIIAAIGLFVAVLGLLFIGAILAPGGTWKEIMDKLKADGDYNFFLLLLVLVAELVIMRHFQAVSGRRMARRLLAGRIQKIEEFTIQPLKVAISAAKAASSPTVERKALEDAKTNFYSIVIYDIFEHNVFGYSPVYVVGPRISYVLNEDALAHIK